MRSDLGAIDSQSLQLLSTRSANVRGAGRFKATEERVKDPLRNQEVIQGVIDAVPSAHMPHIVAKMVFEVIFSSSVLFEVCVMGHHRRL